MFEDGGEELWRERARERAGQGRRCLRSCVCVCVCVCFCRCVHVYETVWPLADHAFRGRQLWDRVDKSSVTRVMDQTCEAHAQV